MTTGQWLTTEPNPRSPATGFDAGQRGWKMHYVAGVGNEDTLPIKGKRAACGLRPRHGFSLDLFIEDKCQRCERALLKAVAMPTTEN